MQALLQAIDQMDMPTDAQRLFHGRGGRFPGCEHLALDAFPPALLLTSFAPLSDDALATIDAALQSRWTALQRSEALCWIYQLRQPGAQAETRVMQGTVPEPHVVTEAGARYGVHVARGQNHGLFLDMAAGRQWVTDAVARRIAVQQAERPHAPARVRVLNLFAYTCAFSVVALRAGAHQCVNMDMSRGALAIGQQNHRLNGVQDGANFLPHDIFSSWGKIGRSAPYDLIVADPPSYQKGSFVATKDYARLVRRLPDLLLPGGYALLCLNAPELPQSFLQDVVTQEAPALQFMGRVANPPLFADVDEDRSLKVLAYQLPPTANAADTAATPQA